MTGEGYWLNSIPSGLSGSATQLFRPTPPLPTPPFTHIFAHFTLIYFALPIHLSSRLFASAAALFCHFTSAPTPLTL